MWFMKVMLHISVKRKTEQGVEVNPTAKIRPTIDKRYIELYCTNPADIQQAGQLEPQSPPPVEEEPQPVHGGQFSANDEILERLRFLRLEQERDHLELLVMLQLMREEMELIFMMRSLTLIWIE
ncbi:hypothetical protein SESBI_28642 [Sesbania bispinosa]|nr:hypothetical protein SESBI_28642 [Sesbania bispinosa]